MRIAILFTLIVTLFLSTFSPVMAISNPDSISIESVKVFKGLFEEDDWLVFMEYHIDYSSGSPTENAEDTFLVTLYDDTDTAQASNVLNYYGHNIISIYLTPSQVLNLGLDWDNIDDYYVRLAGNPTYFPILTEGTNMITYGIDESTDAYDDSVADNRDLFGTLCKLTARSMEDDWPVDLLDSNNRINTTGAVLFNDAVPGIQNIVPDIFSESAKLSEVPTKTEYQSMYPSSNGTVTFTSQFPNVNSHWDKVNWDQFVDNLTGVAEGGNVTTLIDSSYEEDDDYWISATIEIFETTDGLAPQGETSIVTDWDKTTSTFTFGALTAVVTADDKFRLSYNDTYIYSSSTTTQSDAFNLTDITLPDNSTVQSVTVFYTISGSGTGYAYFKPFICLDDLETVGTTRNVRNTTSKTIYSAKLSRPDQESWNQTTIDAVQAGVKVYTSSGSMSGRCYDVRAEVNYTVTNSSGGYAKDLQGKVSEELAASMEDLGGWFGTTGGWILSVGGAILVFLLAARIYVATGVSSAAIVLSIPFVLLFVFLGFIPMGIVLIFGTVVALLFGITFILGRFA